MEEKLVKALLENYKKQGVDLYALVDDPLFVRLPLETKIKIIKKYADVISKGTNTALSKQDIRSLIIDFGFAALGGAASGGASAVAAAGHFIDGSIGGTLGKMPWKAIAAGAAVGGGLFAANTALNALRFRRNRQTMVDSLNKVTDNPTDDNALKVLITRNNQVLPHDQLYAPSAAGKYVKDTLEAIPAKFIGSVLPLRMADKTFKMNVNSTISPHYTKEEVAELARKAHLEAYDPKQFTTK